MLCLKDINNNNKYKELFSRIFFANKYRVESDFLRIIYSQHNIYFCINKIYISAYNKKYSPEQLSRILLYLCSKKKIFKNPLTLNINEYQTFRCLKIRVWGNLQNITRATIQSCIPINSFVSFKHKFVYVIFETFFFKGCRGDDLS